MGKHFDSLVDLVKQDLPRYELDPEFNPNSYLNKAINEFSLFDFPIKKIDLLPNSGKGDEEYDKYLKSYLKMCQEVTGKFIVGPFEKTAIEDPESVVFLDPLGKNRFRTMVGIDFEKLRMEKNSRMIQIADVEVYPEIPKGQVPRNLEEVDGRGSFYCRIMIKYLLKQIGERIYHLVPQNQVEWDFAARDLTNATMAHIQQTVYIMDPENFIIRRENNASKQLQGKIDRRPKLASKPRKTCMRPHYICLDEEDTKKFLSEESVMDETPVYPVRGYWKKLRSEKFVNARGKILRIEQYYRGLGKIDGKNGWHYEVFVKDKDFNVTRIEKGN